MVRTNGALDGLNGTSRPISPRDWDDATIAFSVACGAGTPTGMASALSSIRRGDVLWLWCNPGRKFGGGCGLTARATADRWIGDGVERQLAIRDVALLDRPLGVGLDDGRGDTGPLHDLAGRLWHGALALTPFEDRALAALVDRLSGWRTAIGFWTARLDERAVGRAPALPGRHFLQRTRPRQQAFRRRVFARHRGRCAVTGNTVAAVLEAAHVVPFNGDPLWDRAENGILLRRDLHALYDAFAWSIEPDTGRLRFSAAVLKAHGDPFPYARLIGRAVEHFVPLPLLAHHYGMFLEREGASGQRSAGARPQLVG